MSLMCWGTEEQKKKYLAPQARGEKIASYGLTEPNAGSDAGGTQTTAVRENGGWRVNGTKIYITNGSVAGTIVFTAKTDKNKGTKGISSFIISSDTPGFKVAGQDRKMGVRGVPTADIVFEDCRVPRENLIGGAEGQGFDHAMRTLNSCRPVVGARGVGLAEGCLSYALEFARKREAFGKPIADLQAIQFMLADMAIQIEAARLLVYQGAWRVDQGLYGREHAAYLSIAKAYATEVAVKVASDAMQVLGAQGYMMDHPIERHYRDARQLMIVEGTSQIQRVVIARALLERELVYP